MTIKGQWFSKRKIEITKENFGELLLESAAEALEDAQGERMNEKSESFEDYISKVYLPEFEPIRVENIEHAWNHQEEKLQAEREKVALLRETVEFYGEGEIGNDLEIRPEKKELWSIPEKWSQRSMSDHYAGKRARQALEKLKEVEGEE